MVDVDYKKKKKKEKKKKRQGLKDMAERLTKW